MDGKCETCNGEEVIPGTRGLEDCPDCKPSEKAKTLLIASYLNQNENGSFDGGAFFHSERIKPVSDEMMGRCRGEARKIWDEIEGAHPNCPENVSTIAQALYEKEKRIEEIEEYRFKLEAAFSDRKSQCVNLEAELAEAKARAEKMEKDLKYFRYEEPEKLRAEYQAEIKTIQSQLKKIQPGDECPIHNQKFVVADIKNGFIMICGDCIQARVKELEGGK